MTVAFTVATRPPSPGRRHPHHSSSFFLPHGPLFSMATRSSTKAKVFVE